MEPREFDRDKTEILQLLSNWGILRDADRLDLLAETFAADGVMHTSAWSGSAADFIANAKTSKKAALSQHVYGGGYVEVNGDRALSESRMLVMSRRSVHGVAVELIGFARMVDRFIRTQAGWRILERFPLYERSRLDIADPKASLEIDLAPFADLPEGLRAVAFVQHANGREIPAQTLEMTRNFAKLQADWRAWLNG